MIKTIVYITLILCFVVPVNAGYSEWFPDDGTSPSSYPASGWIHVTETDNDGSCFGLWTEYMSYSSNAPFKTYVFGYGGINKDSCSNTGYSASYTRLTWYDSGWDYLCPGGTCSSRQQFFGTINGTIQTASGSNYIRCEVGVNVVTGDLWVYFSPNVLKMYNITGSIECLDNVSLYSYINNSYKYIGVETGDSYSFGVMDGKQYKLIFSDEHEYEFTVSGSDIVYDHDGCSHTVYRFEDLCGNLIPDTEGFYIEFVSGGLWDQTPVTLFNAPSGILDISNSSAYKIEVYTTTFVGTTGWIIDPVLTETEYTLQNPKISWWLKVKVIDYNTSLPIENVNVCINQSCYIDEYFTRCKVTPDNGMVSYTGMSLQDAGIHVWKDGYKFLNEDSTGYNAFLSGRTNFSGKTWIIKLAPSNSTNESEMFETSNSVGIHFRDSNNNRTSIVKDNEAQIYLYYTNNNTDGSDMTLKFQASSTHSYFSNVLSWSIPHGDIGRKTITNGYFTPYDYSYRAIIYNSSIYGWNITIPLTVREAAAEYTNLTSSLWFMYANAGLIDARENIKIGAHACANNTTLFDDISIELYKDNTLLCYTNLTSSDFINADFQYYYVWEPTHEYVSGSNYSVRMYNDGTLLETDYVECVTDSYARKNKLTVMVKDRSGTPLSNSYIFLEGWGSLSTGSSYYNAYEGLNNGTYRYKASKSGYSSSGWDEIVIVDEDEIVTYTLTYTGSATEQMGAQKMTDEEIKGFFFPLIFLLFVFILLGGLMHVI